MIPAPVMRRAQLEQQIAAARQLRAETLATGAAWSDAGVAFADIFGFIRRGAIPFLSSLMLRRA